MSSWVAGMFESGAIPSVEKGLRFAALRHRLILDNIANADTPGYRRKDLDQRVFRETLRSAEEKVESHRGVLRHDGNDVDMEKELALLGKNASYHNQMASLLRKSFEQIRIAIAERPTAS